MEVGSQQGASQIRPNYGRHQFVPQVVTETIIRYQESNRALERVNLSLPIKNSDAEEKKLKLQRVLNYSAWSKATRPLLDGGKVEHSVNIKLQWGSRRKPRRHVSKVKCVRIRRVRFQARLEPVWTVRGTKVNIESI